jgi:hypothetical protein
MIYLIWSNEHSAWWRLKRIGYTLIIGDAGRYSEAEAREICARANQCRPAGAEPNEVMVLAPESIERIQALEQALSEARETMNALFTIARRHNTDPGVLGCALQLQDALARIDNEEQP